MYGRKDKVLPTQAIVYVGLPDTTPSDLGYRLRFQLVLWKSLCSNELLSLMIQLFQVIPSSKRFELKIVLTKPIGPQFFKTTHSSRINF